MSYKDHKVTEVRKTTWDSLWHVVYTKSDGRETWDRIPEEQALAIARALPPKLARVPLVKRNPRPLARDFPPPSPLPSREEQLENPYLERSPDGRTYVGNAD